MLFLEHSVYRPLRIGNRASLLGMKNGERNGSQRAVESAQLPRSVARDAATIRRRRARWLQATMS